jgi:hypothetical protein
MKNQRRRLMSDAHRRYGAIKTALLQCYPTPTGHRAGHFATLVALICGLVGGCHAHLARIADHAPGGPATQESLIKRFRRWVADDDQTVDSWFLPVAEALLQQLAAQPLTVIMDGSVVGRGCLALMLSVVYAGRALPLAWIVVKGKKGHFPQETHCALLAMIAERLPATASVTFLGDGEFDGIALQALVRQVHWQYVCRTATNILVTAHGETLPIGDLPLAPGDERVLSPAWMTAEQYGPVSILTLWEVGYDHPLYLVTNMTDWAAAVVAYGRRAHIETFFSDQKSRGFQIDRSHLSDPVRLSRLLIASCLAYIWIIYLGVCAVRDGWLGQLHRRDRCDLSLFRLGMRLLARCLKDAIPIPAGFLVPAIAPKRPVRIPRKKAA